MAVCGHNPVGQPGHLDDGPQFGVGELLMDGMVHLGHHAPRRADLDHGRAPPQLLPDRAHALGGAVGQPERSVVVPEVVHPRQRVTVQVAMTARGAEDGTRGIDRGPVEQPLADRLRQVDAEAADLAHRGDAGVQRVGQVTGRPRRAQRGGLLRQPGQVQPPAAHEVTVAVPQPRDERLAAAVDDLCACGHSDGGARTDRDDRALVHNDRLVADRLAAARDQQPGVDPFHGSPSSSAARCSFAGLVAWASEESVRLGWGSHAGGGVRTDRK